MCSDGVRWTGCRNACDSAVGNHGVRERMAGVKQRYLSAVCDFYVGCLSMDCDLVSSHVSLYVFVSGPSGLQMPLS